jgi:hypothetical protein
MEFVVFLLLQTPTPSSFLLISFGAIQIICDTQWEIFCDVPVTSDFENLGNKDFLG